MGRSWSSGAHALAPLCSDMVGTKKVVWALVLTSASPDRKKNAGGKYQRCWLEWQQSSGELDDLYVHLGATENEVRLWWEGPVGPHSITELLIVREERMGFR